jgi:hypothetical protein
MQVPPGFEPLLALSEWALETPNQWTAKRRTASRAELKAFYDSMLPWVEKILDACDAYPLGELPESHRDIFNLTLSLAEISPHVELYKGAVGVPYAYEESRFIAVHGEDLAWQALQPNRPRVPSW